MRRKKYLYHVTQPNNVKSILQNGLLRSAAKEHTAIAVYLSEKPLSWYQDGLEILRVDISGLEEMKATTFLPDSDEILFWGDIPAWKMTKNGWKSRFELVTDKYIENNSLKDPVYHSAAK